MKKSLLLSGATEADIESTHEQKRWPKTTVSVWTMDIPIKINDELDMTSYVGVHSYEWIGKTYQEGPFKISGNIYLASPAKVKLSLYIPKPALEFSNNNKRFYLQGFTEPSFGENLDEEADVTNSLSENFQKIYEFPDIIDVAFRTKDIDLCVWKRMDDPDYAYCYRGINGDKSLNLNWDGMTDPQFTGGAGYPVFDAVIVVVQDAETGEIIDAGLPWSISRYRTEVVAKYTALQNSVQADIYFACPYPIKDVTAFLVNDCSSIPAIQWTDFQVSGKKAISDALGKSNALKAYKSFVNTDDADDTMDKYKVNNVLYHLRWEITGRNGKPYDPGDNPERHYLGLIIEGADTAVNMTGKDGFITDIDYVNWIGSMPRPLQIEPYFVMPE
jgi:hypothetical protein